MITASSRELIRLYQHYKNGVLLQAGGILNQPQAYAQAMETLDQYGYEK